MPPRAIASRVSTHHRPAPRRRRNSSTIDGGNFGEAPKPPLTPSYSRSSSVTACAERLLGDRARGHRRRPAQVLAQLAGHALDVLGLGLPRVGQRLEHLPEARLPVPRLVREVGAREERVAVVVEHACHRPPAVPGHRRGRVHVDGVHVRPLLAVDLDADEVLVEVRRGGLVLERLVRHHVAPVAGGVPDAQQHRHVAPPRLLERRRLPLPPVDRIVGVLEEIGAGCRSKTVHVAIIARPRPRHSRPLSDT